MYQSRNESSDEYKKYIPNDSDDLYGWPHHNSGRPQLAIFAPLVIAEVSCCIICLKGKE